MKERDQGASKFSAASSAPSEGLLLKIFGSRYICRMRDTLPWHCELRPPPEHVLAPNIFNVQYESAIRSHCGSDLAILHTPAALDQMACPTIVGSESSAKLSRDGRIVTRCKS